MFFIFSIFCEGGKMEEIKLPEPLKTNEKIEVCIEKRRSIRRFKKDTLSMQEISTLLWATQGITEKKREFRTAPSAGATYPLEVYLLKHDGFFRYIPSRHSLVKISDKDMRKELCKACLGQSYVEEAPIDIVITAIPERTTRYYGERGIRYVWIEVGHAAQNLHLEAVALGLGSVPIGAFHDEEIKNLMKLKENEIPCYVIPVGHPK